MVLPSVVVSSVLTVYTIVYGCSASSLDACSSLLNRTGVAEAESWRITSSIFNCSRPSAYCYATVRIGQRITTWLKLPEVAKWNERYVQVGCGGGCGYNAFEGKNDFFNSTMIVSEGYATSANDVGVQYPEPRKHLDKG